MTHGSLFSGIGGFDLAAEWMGWENIFHCEFDPFCQKVLQHHFPNSKLFNDVKTFDATAYAGRIDLLSGGFPCQPFSSAGLRKGKEDDRHLWPEMLRIIREISPKYVVGENVRGLLNWSGGLVFDEVCSDLEDAGYEVTPYLLPACGINAPHRRDRIWFIAHAHGTSKGNNVGTNKGETKEVWREKESNVPTKLCGDGDAPDTPCFRGGEVVRRPNRESNEFNEDGKVRNWENFPTQSPLCGGDDGLPKELDGISFSKWRKENLKVYGNAIVPQVAHEVFKAIQKMEDS